MIEIIKEIFAKHKFGIIGLILGTILINFTIIISLDSFLEKGIKTFSTRCFIYIGITLIWFVVWWISKEYFPKNEKGKIGVVISITTENDKQKSRIKNDFIKGLNDITLRNNLIDKLNFINLEDYKELKINEIIINYNSIYRNCVKNNKFDQLKYSKEFKKFNKVLNKIKGHLYIYGSIKERQDQENKYFIKVNACIRHEPIKVELSNEIAKEFQAILPKEISFYEKFESQGFEFASDIVFHAARYMIGVAAMLSYDPFIAYTIHNGLFNDLNKYKPQPPNIKYISNKLSLLLTEELLQQSKYYFSVKNDLITANRLLDQAESINKTNYHVYIFRSYYAFQIELNPNKSLEFCKIAKKFANGDGTWLYNQAFLNIYLEKFEEAYNDYKKIRDSSFRDEIYTINECIQFNEDFIKKTPSFFQALFVLGYLYYFKANNFPVALEKFELFLTSTNNMSKFNFLQQKVTLLVIEIKKEMNIN